MHNGKTLTIPQALRTAVRFVQSGQLQQAEQICQRIVAAEPGNAEAHHLLGIIALQSGKIDQAVELIRRATEINPQAPSYCINLGNAFRAQGRPDEAIQSYQKALRLKPGNAMAHNNLGAVLRSQGRLNEAIRSFKQALQHEPDYAEAHYNLGNSLAEQNSPDEAAAAFKRALEILPRYAEAHYNLGLILMGQNKLDAAEKSIRQAIKLRPDHPEAYNNLGLVLIKLDKPDEAEKSIRQAIRLNPENAEAYNSLGIVLHLQDKLADAVSSYKQAVKIKPDYAEAFFNLGKVLRAQGALDDAVSSYRRAVAINPEFAEAYYNLGIAYLEQARPDKACDSYRRALSINRHLNSAHSNLLFSLNYLQGVSQKDIYIEARQWDKQHAESLSEKEIIYENSRDKGRRLRIGYVSPDFRKHSVAYFIEPLLKAHDKEKVEVYCYANINKPDEATDRIKNETDHWSLINEKNDAAVAEEIRKDRIDILVDLAGHTRDNRLLVFARKPAPIQVTWLGYPNTTGLSAIDYRFTDVIADPPGEADNLYSEELVRLDKGFLCYQPKESAPAVSSLPCLERGYITFGSFNNLSKTQPGVVRVWSEILRRMPNAHLVFKTKQLADKGVKERYLKMFEQEGVAADRVELYEAIPKHEDHLGFYSRVDIGLDPFPYNGTTTTCEAIWMGVPVIMMSGNRHAGRVGASILHHVGLDELPVAATKEIYVEAAVGLANDKEKLIELRKSLRQKMMNSTLCDAKVFAQCVEEAYRTMWEGYISSNPL